VHIELLQLALDLAAAGMCIHQGTIATASMHTMLAEGNLQLLDKH